MNTVNNKRRQETVRRIEAAFLELLKEQELGKINISKLCEMAGINRGTFYANYEDVYHLAEMVLLRLENEVSALLERNVKKAYCENDFLKLFEHIKENQEIYWVYFRLGGERAKDLELFRISTLEEVENLDLHISFFMSGFNGLIVKWLSEGCKQTPKEMLEVLVREYQGRISWKLL